MLPTLRAAESAEPVGRKPAPQLVEVRSDGRSPALCGPEDDPETGAQGDVPHEDQLSGRAAEGYECGISVVGRLDREGGNGAGAGHCTLDEIVWATTWEGDPDRLFTTTLGTTRGLRHLSLTGGWRRAVILDDLLEDPVDRFV